MSHRTIHYLYCSLDDFSVVRRKKRILPIHVLVEFRNGAPDFDHEKGDRERGEGKINYQ